MHIHTLKELYVQLKQSDLNKVTQFYLNLFYIKVLIMEIQESSISKEKFVHLNIKRHIKNNTTLCDGEFLKGLKWLESNGWIEINHSYCVGSYTKGYKAIYKEGDGFITIDSKKLIETKTLNAYKKKKSLMDSNLQVEIFNHLKINEGKLNLAIMSKFNKSYSELTLDIKNKEEFYYQYSIEMWKNKSFSFSVSELTGRLYSNLTNLPKLIRNCLEDDRGLKIYTIDIVNSQPSLILSLIKKNNLKCESKMIKIIESGKFYEEIGKILKIDNRDYTKEIFYSNLAFADSSIIKHSAHTNKIKNKYPEFINSILELSNQTKSLAAQLQKIESDLIFNFIKSTNLKCCTIHDCLLLSVKKEYLVKKINLEFKNYLIKETNINIKTKMEEL